MEAVGEKFPSIGDDDVYEPFNFGNYREMTEEEIAALSEEERGYLPKDLDLSHILVPIGYRD